MNIKADNSTHEEVWGEGRTHKPQLNMITLGTELTRDLNER